jgi:hypothetical protein
MAMLNAVVTRSGPGHDSSLATEKQTD